MMRMMMMKLRMDSRRSGVVVNIDDMPYEV